MAETIHQAFGGLDVLFLNAGIAELRPVEQWDEAGFDRSFASNVEGPCFSIQALLPLLANPASVVINASVNARIGMPNSSVYGAAKAAITCCVTPFRRADLARYPRECRRSPARSLFLFTANSASPRPISKRSPLPFRARSRSGASEIPWNCRRLDLSRVGRIRISVVADIQIDGGIGTL